VYANRWRIRGERGPDVLWLLLMLLSVLGRHLRRIGAFDAILAAVPKDAA